MFKCQCYEDDLWYSDYAENCSLKYLLIILDLRSYYLINHIDQIAMLMNN